MQGTELKRVVVTGAAGFLGRLVAARLVARGVRVLGVDLAPLPEGAQGAWGHLALPLDQAAVACQDFLAQAPARGAALLHLAGLADAAACTADPARAFALNVGLVEQALAICRRARGPAEHGAAFVLPSTGLVYGPGVDTGLPLGEDTPTRPWGLYAGTKLAAEALVLAHAAEQGLPVAVARLSNVYGAGGGVNTVVGHILAQAQAGGPVAVRDERPVRDFLHAHDAAEGLIRLAQAALAQGPGAGIVANLSTAVGTSVAQVVDMACELFHVSRGTGSTATGLQPLPLVLDNAKLARSTGWKPGIPLREGLALPATTPHTT